MARTYRRWLFTNTQGLAIDGVVGRILRSSATWIDAVDAILHGIAQYLGAACKRLGSIPRPGEHAGWMGQRYNPLTTKVDKRDLKDNPYWRDCTDQELTYAISGMDSRSGITLDRLRGRQSLLDQLNTQRAQVENSGALSGYDAFRQRAFSLVTSPAARDALDITHERLRCETVTVVISLDNRR